MFLFLEFSNFCNSLRAFLALIASDNIFNDFSLFFCSACFSIFFHIFRLLFLIFFCSLICLCVFVRYIYIISFRNTNDIYVGKTERQDIIKRFKEHKSQICTVSLYVKDKFNGDWSNVYIDVIDSIDMDEDLTYIHTFSFIELLNRGRHSALWKWRPSAP